MNIFARFRFAGVSRLTAPLLLLVVFSFAQRGYADTLVGSTAFSYVGQSVQTYTVPANTDYVVIKAWGGAGGSTTDTSNTGWSFTSNFRAGVEGSFVSTKYDVLAGAQLSVTVGGGGVGRTDTWHAAAPGESGGLLVCNGGWPGGGNGTALVALIPVSVSVNYSGAFGGGGGGGFSRVQTDYGTVWAGGGGGGGQRDGSYLANGTPGTPEQGGAQVSPPGGGGGGGGLVGGNAGGSNYSGYAIRSGAGASGTSFASGFASETSFTNPGGYGLIGTTSSPNGGNGRVVIEAYTRSGISNNGIFVATATGQTSTYTVPAGTGYVVVKAWGSGGAGGVGSSGGAGAFVKGTYAVAAGQTITINPGYAGAASVVTVSAGSAFLYAGGGGAGGYGAGTSGGAAGTTSGSAGGSFTGAAGGAGGSTTGSAPSFLAVGGAGGAGNAYYTDHEYDEDGNETGSTDVTVGLGKNGTTGPSSDGGAPGDLGDNGLSGGRGGGGFGGGGGGGSGQSGGGGGGGGSSVLVGNSSTPVAGVMQAGSGATAPNTSDADYPGSGVGGGGAAGGAGGAGAVVIIAYPVLPQINSAPTQVVGLNQPVSYWVTAANSPTSFSATGLPPGLTFNTANGNISGTPTTSGSYTVTIGATNLSGTSQTTMTWIIDSTAPTAPTTLQASNQGATAFTLSWSGATDDVGIADYEVRQNGTSVGFISGTSMAVAGLSPSTTYVMSVRTRDRAGNWSSGWSTDFSVTTPADTTAPTVPIGLKALNVTASVLALQWAPSSDDLGVTAYQVEQNGTTLTTTPTIAAVTLTALTADTNYSYRVRARDAAGNWSGWSVSQTFKTAKASPDILIASTTLSTAGMVAQPYTVPADVDYVVIKVWGGGGGSRGSTTPGGMAGFVSATYPATPGQTFAVTVGYGGMASASVFTGGGSNLQATAGSGGWPGGGSGVPTVSGGGGYSAVVTPSGTVWAAGGASLFYMAPYNPLGGLMPGMGTNFATGSGYNIQTPSVGDAVSTDPNYPGNYVGYGGSISDTLVGGIPAGGTYGTNGVNGGNGAVVILAYKTPVTSPPTTTQTYFRSSAASTYVVPAGTDHIVVKAWGGGGASTEYTAGAGGGFASNSYTPIAGQSVIVAVGQGGNSSGGAGGASVVTLPGGATLSAAGGGGGNGEEGDPVGSTTPSTISDSYYPGNYVAYGSDPGTGNSGHGGAVVIITYFSTPVITSPTNYYALPGAAVNYTITGTNGPTSFSATGLPAGLTLDPVTGVISGTTNVASATSTITATNRGGSQSVTLTWTFAVDSTAPTAPTGLAASAIYSNSFLLTWNVSTDNFAVTGYEVRRNGVVLGAATTGRTMAILGLTSSTTYPMEVRARDAAGNWSSWSSVLNVTTTTSASPAPSLATSTYSASTSTQTYTVPSGVNYVTIKAWGAGGRGLASTGGAGAYIAAGFNVTPGQTIAASPGYSAHPSGYGSAGATKVTLPGSSVMYAGAGGNSGEHSAGRGGAGGAPLGEAGGGGADGLSGGGGGGVGVGGTGGLGNGVYDVDDDESGPDPVGHGQNGGVFGQYDDSGGGEGYPGNQYSSNPYKGGRGGGGLAGGGGGGGGADGSGGGGGGGGSSGIVVGTLSPLSSLMLAGSVTTAPNTSDANYPGGNVAVGGAISSNGGNGFVAILAYSGPPPVTSGLTKSVVQNQAVSYSITVGGQATSFASSGLPAGLTLDPVTGVISGSTPTTGTYNSVIGATSANGTAMATLVWTVTADSTAPSAPQTLVATNLTTTSFRLTWAPSTDNVAVASYEVFRGGVSMGSTANPYLDLTGLVQGTTYSCTVKARDGAGNASAESSALSVTISTDTQVPTTVAGLALAGQTATTSTLTWAPAGDNFGVVAYEVYDGSTLLGTTAELSFVHAATGSHSYTVLAVDAAGKKSAVSATLSVGSTSGATDTDGDGIPDAIETSALLNTNPNSAATKATDATLPLNLHRPTP